MADGPRGTDYQLDCETDERTLNQYCLFDIHGNSESRKARSKRHVDLLFLLIRTGSEWALKQPDFTPSAQDDEPDEYCMTQVAGVEIKTVSSSSPLATKQQSWHRRYKITPDAVRGTDEFWVVRCREEVGGSDSGEYHRVKDGAATLIEVA
jgi:hypothetical protein